METGAFHHVFHIQLPAVLQAVDAFMLRAVVLVYPADILHGRDGRHVDQKNGQPHQALQNGEQGSVADKALEQQADPEGQGDEDGHRQDDGKGDRQPHEKLFSISLRRPVQHGVRLRLLRFLILVKARGPGQRLHAKHHGVYEIENAAGKRQLRDPPASPDALILFFLRFDPAVRPAHRYGVLFPVFHHDAFQDRLSADPGIVSAFFRAHRYPYPPSFLLHVPQAEPYKKG